jgi:predicted ester cyclase
VLIIEGSLGQVADFFTVDDVAHVTGRDLARGYEVVKQVVRAYRAAFSELELTIEVLVKAKNRIAWQRTFKAIHTGPFKGFPASHRPMVWRDMITSEFRDGRIAEEWVVTDLAEQLLLARK